MNLYQKLSQKVETCQIKTLTLDIFDTILLRKVWPEDIQFLKVANKWAPLFQKLFSSKITKEELYSYRLYARNELITAHRKYDQLAKGKDKKTKNASDLSTEYDVTLETWFNQIIDLFLVKYHVKLPTETRAKLLNAMIKIELDTEKQNLTPNYCLIAAIKKLKKSHQNLKVFFVSDMYLTSEDLKELFEFFKIDIFDGGITSTEAKHAKSSGGLFDYLHEQKVLTPDFDISANLHIGDNKTSDFRNPQTSGSAAILYHKPRFRTLKTFCGRVKKHQIAQKIIKKDKLLLSANLRHSTTPASIWRYYGRLFGQPLFVFLEHLLISAKACPKTTFLMVSSEANVFEYYGNLLTPDFKTQKNIVPAAKLNRKCIIRALIYTLIKSKNFDYDPETIFKIGNLGELDGSRDEFYKFIFGKKYSYSEMEVNFRSEKNFFKALLKELATADAEYLKPFKDAYKYAHSFLPKTQSEKVVIVDVGWGGTIQVLFSQFAGLHGYRAEIEGLYLGVLPNNRYGIHAMPPMEGYLLKDVQYGKDRQLFNAVLWEYPYTNKPQFSGDLAHLEQIRIGIEESLKILSHTTLAPKPYFDSVVREEIKRLVTHPTKAEVINIGSIKFDMGFGNESSFHIVEMGYRRGWMHRQIFRHPRRIIRDIIFAPNHWAAGTLKYYHLPFVRPFIKLYARISKKTLI